MEYITIKDIATDLKLSVSKVRLMCEKNELPAIKLGRVWRVRKSDFEAFMESLKR